ncbi:hypothetical protein [Isobaculum melis]|uniref:Uncharacterized protein n=1 Tax=Isobaculum melis TaxID=142588 RepID=A0A1H9S9B3_9LACT|nr:hypothetical protein [Isobaculum melis]SER80963.1 hypothetical protein SAMN04488559_106128 [Isobaculum melis]
MNMSTKRHGEEENRASFKEAKNKEIFEASIDKQREQVAKEKEEKEAKRNLKEEARREKEGK